VKEVNGRMSGMKKEKKLQKTQERIEKRAMKDG
jgi:hypothetical protein